MTTDIFMSSTHHQFEEEEFLMFRKKRILLIEEDWDLSQLLSSLISKHLDIEVEVVKNPFQGLSRMTHEPYDVIVLDSRVNPYQALIEAEEFMEPVLENHFSDTGKIPVIVLVDDEDGDESSIQGLESHYFRIMSAVRKDPRLTQTLSRVEDEINEILEL